MQRVSAERRVLLDADTQLGAFGPGAESKERKPRKSRNSVPRRGNLVNSVPGKGNLEHSIPDQGSVLNFFPVPGPEKLNSLPGLENSVPERGNSMPRLAAPAGPGEAQ